MSYDHFPWETSTFILTTRRGDFTHYSAYGKDWKDYLSLRNLVALGFQLLNQVVDMTPGWSFYPILLLETSGNGRILPSRQLVLHNKCSLRCWELMIAAIVHWFRIGLTCYVETELRNDELKTQVLRGNKMAGICSYSCTQSGAKSTGCPVFPVAKFWKLS